MQCGCSNRIIFEDKDVYLSLTSAYAMIIKGMQRNLITRRQLKYGHISIFSSSKSWNRVLDRHGSVIILRYNSHMIFFYLRQVIQKALSKSHPSVLQVACGPVGKKKGWIFPRMFELRKTIILYQLTFLPTSPV